MCEPTTIAVVTAVSTAYGLYAQNQQTQQANKAAAREQLFRTVQAGIEDQQAADEARASVVQRQKEALRERGLILAAGADAGFGRTTDRLLGASEVAAEQDQQSIILNRENSRSQNALEVAAGRESLRYSRRSGVNPFLGALQVGTAAAGGYVTGAQYQEALKKK